MKPSTKKFLTAMGLYALSWAFVPASQAIVFWFDERIPLNQVEDAYGKQLLAASGGIFCTDGTIGTGFLIDVSRYLAEGETVRVVVSTARVLINQENGYNRAICAFQPASSPDRSIRVGERLAGWNKVGFMDRNDWAFARLEEPGDLPKGLVLDFAAARDLTSGAQLLTVGYAKKFGSLALSDDCEMAKIYADPNVLLDRGPLPFIIHDCDLHGSATGGPLAIRVESSVRIVGINVGDGQEEAFESLSYLPFDLVRKFFNYGRRLDSDMENKLVAFLSRFSDLRSPSEAIQARRVLIRAVQANLARLGYEVGTADGLLGHRTREAVRAFKTSLGINPTGDVSEELLLLLQAR